VTPLVFVDRSRRADRYPWFEWKVRLFLAGAALGIVGMAAGMDWLVAVGIVILGGGFLLRFLPSGRGAPADPGTEGD
jgi:hypothetical protein